MHTSTYSYFKQLKTVSYLAVGLLAVLPQTASAQATHVSNDWAQIDTGYKNDSLRDFLTRLSSAIDVANKDPKLKQPVTFKANVTAEGRTGIRHLRIRSFQFLSDGAVNSGEYNLGPGSWPTIVGILGSAVAQDYLIQAAIKGIPIDSLEVIFSSTPGPAPSWTGRTITYPRDLAYTAYIVSPASDTKLEELKQTVERESAVLNLVREKQEIPHAELVYTQTPKDLGTALAGLREYLEGKRAASQRPRVASDSPPPTASQPVTGTPTATTAQPTVGTPSDTASATIAGANTPGRSRRQRNSSADRNTQAPRTGGANENAPLRADVKVQGATGIREIRTDEDNFQIIHDFPRYLGGHNLGPVAEEHILGVMLTCLTHIFEIQAANRGVDLDSLRLEVEGTLNPQVGSKGQSPRITNIHYKAFIGSPESQETVAQLVEAVEGVCPIYNLLRNANEVNGKIIRGPYLGQTATDVLAPKE